MCVLFCAMSRAGSDHMEDGRSSYVQTEGEDVKSE